MLRVVAMVRVLAVVLGADVLVLLVIAQQALHAFLRFRFLLALVFPLLEPGQPNADLVEEIHRHGHQRERHDVRCRCQYRCEDHDADDRVAAGLPHRRVTEEAQLDDDHDDDRKLERNAEQQGESGGEGDVVADPPFVGDA